jgi:hypothetical protein
VEERRFDDLSRALGRGTSRRTVLKGIFGAALGGVLAAVGVRAPHAVEAAVPDCNGVPYDPVSQCCEPAGIQPLHPIAVLDFCPNRVPHPGHVPEVNGCGPANGLVSHLIPNKVGPFYNPRAVDFTPACNNHDVCYDTCNSDKNTCDSNFLTQMRAACAAVYPGRGYYDRRMRASCETDAYIYYLAVSRVGGDAYESAQKGACDCCANCQECGGPTDERCCGGTCHEDCPDGKTRDSQTCECVCAESCPPDKHQNPDTCECEDLCENVTCSECHVCNPQTGDCVQGNDQEPCGTDQVCCGGVCKDDCSCPPSQVMCAGVCCDQNEICVDNVCQAPGGCDPACGPDEICCNEIGYDPEAGPRYVCKSTSEYKICPVTPSDGGQGFYRDDYICCPIDLDCCGGTGYLYNVCGGPGDGQCCPAGTQACSDFCCDFGWDEGHCQYLESGWTCIPN